MNRMAAILILLSLGFAACAHDHALERSEVAAMKNDTPAISPWLGPVSSNPYPQGPGDEK
jgi:hypothetical protein